jgi:hypothetical protein
MPRRDDTEPCQHCGKEVYEDAERCPHCGNYITDEDEGAPPSRKPWWIIICTLLCFYAIYRWITYGG